MAKKITKKLNKTAKKSVGKKPVVKKLSRGKSQFLEFNIKEQELEKNKSLKKDHIGKS